MSALIQISRGVLPLYNSSRVRTAAEPEGHHHHRGFGGGARPSTGAWTGRAGGEQPQDRWNGGLALERRNGVTNTSSTFVNPRGLCIFTQGWVPSGDAPVLDAIAVVHSFTGESRSVSSIRRR